MLIRKFRPADAKNGLLTILKDLTTVGSISDRELKRIIKIWAENDVYCIFIAKYGGKIVGATTLLIEQKFIHQGGKAGHIEDVVVLGGCRGYGIGSALIAAAIKEAKKAGCYRTTLYCSHKNARFYEKCGLRKIPDAVVMRIDFMR